MPFSPVHKLFCKVLQVPETSDLREMPRAAMIRTLVAVPAFLGYVMTLGAWWNIRSRVRKRATIATEVHSSTFGVMVYLGPVVVEYLGYAYPECDVMVMGDFNGANKFALRRLNEKSPQNVHIHSSALFRRILSWYRPRSLANPAVSLWNRPRYPHFAKPQVLTFAAIMERCQHLKSDAPRLSREYFGLTRIESEECRTQLERNGLDLGNGFVCFNVRDDSWRQARQSQLFMEPVPRPENSDIQTYVPAILAVLDAGKAVIRVGREVMNRVEIGNPNFLDYANSDIRHDIMDFFFGEFCDLAVSTGTGWDTVPRIMGRNVHLANFTVQDVASFAGLWTESFPPISVGYKKSMSIESGGVSLGLRGGPVTYESVFFPEAGPADYLLQDQPSSELILQVLFALRLQQDPLYLRQMCRDQASFQSEWWMAFGGEQTCTPRWLPLMEPVYLTQYGRSLIAGV